MLPVFQLRLHPVFGPVPSVRKKTSTMLVLDVMFGGRKKFGSD